VRSKLPLDSFAYYASLGPDRSYAAVAAYFKVAKKTVVRRAKAEEWRAKIADIEREAQERTQKRLVLDLAEMNERHLKVLRVVLNKALETLRATPLRTGADAVRAIDLCVRHERVIMGDPTEQQTKSIEEVTKKEFARWMRDNTQDEIDHATAGFPGADETAEEDGDEHAP
jgi:hypothetical protein